MIEKSSKTYREMQKEDTRRLILDSAYVLFAEKGYEKTTMRALAEKAGIGLGTIFKHFPDKASLLVAAFQEDLNQLILQAFTCLPETGYKAQLLHITRHIYEFYATNPQLSRTLVKEVLFLEGELGEILFAEVASFLEVITELLEEAKARNELRDDFDCMNGAMAYWAFYLNVLLLGLRSSVFDIEQQLALLEGLIDNHFK